MSAITTDGNLIHYEVLGRGRPVIFVHGWIGSWRYWIPTLQTLQAKYRVYALDLYGFGDSAKNPQRYSLEQQVTLLDTFMQELGIPKAALVGHGLGAMVVAEYARRSPENVPRVLITGAPLFDPGDLAKRVPAGRRPLPVRPAVPEAEPVVNTATVTSASAAAMRAALLQAARTRVTPQDMMPSAGFSASSNHNPLIPLMESPDALLAKCFRRSETNYQKLSVDVAKIDAPVLRQSVEGFDAGRLLDTLRLLTAPVLIIHGGDDPLIPQPSDEVLNYLTLDKEHAVMPILLPNVRHFPMLEDDRFGRLVNEFLEAADMSRLALKERWRRRTR